MIYTSNSVKSFNNMKKYNFWFRDIEVFQNFFCTYFKNRDTKEEKYFIIHESKNQINEMLDFYQSLLPTEEQVSILIGFNSINYDYPVEYYIMNDLRAYKHQFDNPLQITSLIKKESDRVLNEKWSAIYSNNVQIPQIDPYKIHHFDNPAKRTSLKYIESTLRMDEIQTYEDFNKWVEEEDIPEILYYNRHDVNATELFFYETLPDILMRKELTKEYGIDLMNADDPKLGVEIFAIPIAEKLGVTVDQLKKLRTFRKEIDLKDCILPKINFKLKIFQDVLNWFNRQTIDANNTKKAVEYTFNYNKVDYTYGIGGLHACIKSGVYESTDTHKILDIDVGSFYTALGIKNGLAPAHLGKAFSGPLEEKFNYRLSIKKDKSKAAIAGGWKLALNGVYGKSQSMYSYFYDPKYTFSITINGQLFLTMLVDRILFALQDDCQLLQINTDGITLLINRNDEKLILDICKAWEKYTELTLEYVSYKKMCIRDVNNYLSVKDVPEDELCPQFPESHWYQNEYTKHKTKGAYQVVPERNGKIAYDKNWNHRVVPMAVHDYFVHGVPIQKSIMECKNILDFCGTFKADDKYKTVFTKSDGSKIELGKVTRYYISSGGGRLQKVRKVKLKEGEKGSNQSDIESGYSTTIFNKVIKFNDFSKYNIDYTYYIREANKLIKGIEKVEQLKLGLF